MFKISFLQKIEIFCKSHNDLVQKLLCSGHGENKLFFFGFLYLRASNAEVYSSILLVQYFISVQVICKFHADLIEVKDIVLEESQ